MGNTPHDDGKHPRDRVGRFTHHIHSEPEISLGSMSYDDLIDEYSKPDDERAAAARKFLSDAVKQVLDWDEVTRRQPEILKAAALEVTRGPNGKLVLTDVYDHRGTSLDPYTIYFGGVTGNADESPFYARDILPEGVSTARLDVGALVEGRIEILPSPRRTPPFPTGHREQHP